MAQQAKVVKVGPGGRNNGPRPKVENPGKVFKRILGYVMNQYKAQVIIVLCCICWQCLPSCRVSCFPRR